MIGQLIKMYITGKVMRYIIDKTRSKFKNKKVQMLVLLLALFGYLHLYYFVVVDTKPTFYDTLGLSKKATYVDIKKSFRDMSKKYHPDVNPDASDIYLKNNELYEILIDKESKWMYDRFNIKLKEFRGKRLA